MKLLESRIKSFNKGDYIGKYKSHYHLFLACIFTVYFLYHLREKS